MKRVLALIVVAAYLFGCENETHPPARPIGVPEAASWGGGVDGGNWIHCAEGKTPHTYACSVYWDSDGTVRSMGTYVLRRVSWDVDQDKVIYSDVDGQPEINFDYFDGILIHLKGDFALVPNGIIESPFGDGRGKKQRYELGKPLGPEEEY